MLVLTRKVGETIEIGDDIVVMVKRVDRGKVRLGIIAPKELDIRRRGGLGPKVSWMGIPVEIDDSIPPGQLRLVNREKP